MPCMVFVFQKQKHARTVLCMGRVETDGDCLSYPQTGI